MKNKKGQVGIELIIIIGALLFFIVVFLGVISSNTLDKNKERQEIITRQVAMDVRDEIALASSSSDGYYRIFKVPNMLGNKEYNISLVDGFVYLKTHDNKNSIALAIENISGNISKGNNIIRKNNGSVFINS